MFTSQAASMLRTLDGVMPNTSLRDMVQIFANCSQTLSHRGGTDLSPPAFPYLKNGVNTKAPLSWDPGSPGYNLGPATNNSGYYNNAGDSPYFDFASRDYMPYFEGPSNFSDNSSQSAINRNSYSFPFAQNIRSDSLYGGPTVNIAGDSYFDNSHADTYNGDTVTTKNLNVGGGTIKMGDTYIDNSVVRNYFGDQNGGNIGNINLIDLINQFNRRIPTMGIADASRKRYVEKCYSSSRRFLWLDPVPTKLDLASHLKLANVPEFTGTEVNLTINSAMADSSMTGKITYDKPTADGDGLIPVTVTLLTDSSYSIPNYTGTVNLTGNIPYPTLDKASTNIGNGWSVAGTNGTVSVAAVTANFVTVDVPTEWYLDQSKCTVTATKYQTFLVVSSLNGGGGGNATFSIPAQACYATSNQTVVTSASLSEGTKAVSALTATLATGKAYEIQKIKSAVGALQLSYTTTNAVTNGFTIKDPTITSTCKYTPEGTVTAPNLANTGGDLEIPNVKQESGKTTFLTQAIVQQSLFLDSRWITLR